MTAPTLVDGMRYDPLMSVADATAVLTRRWWALVYVHGQWRLVEAGGHEELTRAIVDAWSENL